jgi:multiple sugar transport system permease protein
VISGLVVILLWKSFYGESEYGVLNALLMRIPAIAFLAAGVFCLAAGWIFAGRLLLHDLRGSAAGALAVGVLLLLTCVGIAAPILEQTALPWGGRLFATLPEPIRWLTDPRTAMLACVIPLAWAGIGPGCLIYLAALKGIADELYEAADIDGAGFTDKVLFIVFPMLRPLLVINFVGVFIGSWFFSESNILAMTGGGADTEIAGLKIFYEAFIFLRFGPATAMAWLLGLLLIGFTMYQLRILARVEFRAGEG